MTFEEQFLQLETAVRAKLDAACGCHDYDHTRRVMNHSVMLLKELPAADAAVVRTAALLHDFARPEESASKGTICHAVLGAELVKPLLAELDFPAAFIEQVSHCILTHRYRANRQPQSLEAKIVYDADKLDSLGAVGIGRAFLFAGREHARMHNLAEEALNSPAYSREDTAYREYLVKLCKLPDCMLTEPGRRIAVSRAAYMAAFFDELNRECFTAFEP